MKSLRPGKASNTVSASGPASPAPSLNERRIPLRQRPELAAYPQQFRGERVWCLKDATSLRFFHLNNEEYHIFRWLDGRRTVGELLSLFRAEFPAVRITPDRIVAFVSQLGREGLLISDAPGHGASLWSAARRRDMLRTLMLPSGVLSIRLPGIDPQPLLRPLTALCGWAFGPVGLVLGTIWIALGAAALFSMSDELVRSLPLMSEFLTVDNVLLLLATIAAMKVLHEFGHGICCLRVGGECRELGVLLLVFTPCLYCDVSDTWRMPEKWKRIAVGLAGIWVELLLAATAALVWCGSEPGIWRTLALNVMLIGSINTLLFNGNPLLRYDGYFVLSDLLEIPNLAVEAGQRWRELLRNWFFPGSEHQSFDARNRTLLVYGLLSTLYRLFVLAVIWLLVWRVLEPCGLGAVAIAMGAFLVVGLVLSPIMNVATLLKSPSLRASFSIPRAIGSAVAFAFLIGLCVALPLPDAVSAPVTIQPAEGAPVYVARGGRIDSAVASGAFVKRGDVLMKLNDADLTRELIESKSEIAAATARLAGLEARRFAEPEAAALLELTRESLNSLNETVAELRRKRDRLSIRAPITGQVVAGINRPASSDSTAEPDPAGSPNWTGTPLARKNRGAWLLPGTLICEIAPSENREGVALVSEDGIERIAVGTEVRLCLDARPLEVIEGRVAVIAEEPVRDLPEEVIRSGRLAAKAAGDGSVESNQTVYEVRIVFSNEDKVAGLPVRSTGTARLSAPGRTLWERVYTGLRRVFNLNA
ncbi:hypothetical protein [Stratiformator vulcanicus]|uniref:Peptidase family M50 n=1 Tax=Stratiformator vulcanicus TaxID=2527980 RepID=A0A517QZD3_9PLAN|nr:hypothetical protein [Stratiformator vulcanicus]QDT37007.1 Peptidase family M50 [Stratiformator vulcanicus]